MAPKSLLKSAERADDAFPDWLEGAKAAAEAARRERIAAVFMVADLSLTLKLTKEVSGGREEETTKGKIGLTTLLHTGRGTFLERRQRSRNASWFQLTYCRT